MIRCLISFLATASSLARVLEASMLPARLVGTVAIGIISFFPILIISYQDKTYQIPIIFKILSGSEFESDSLKYANYGIYLTVSLIDNQGNDVLSRTDYVKFTNTRIYIADKVTP